ncbi:MAG: alpha/beta hydrolase [Firmicutes bacterium]|jgi:acetyl esterase/lipase|nr:alpha/beta hydrolase [Bacillota bacterium]
MTVAELPLWTGQVPGALGNEEEDRPSLISYLIPGDERRAAVVVCPGGGYARRAAHEGEPIARWLNSLGLHAFVLRYRVAPYRHPYPLMDAQRAMRLVRFKADEWKVNPELVGILGFSAGGHLASTVGTHFDRGTPSSSDPVMRHSCRPDFMILCYPVITFSETSAHVGSIRNLLGPEPSDELCRHLSNELHVNADTPPTFLWHTANDSGVPVENSLLFAAALSRHGVPWEMHIFADGRHGLGLAEEHPEVKAWPGLCARWLAKICADS